MSKLSDGKSKIEMADGQKIDIAVKLWFTRPLHVTYRQEFSESIFETCIKKNIVGGLDDKGNKDPYLLTFVFKSGFKTIIEQNKAIKKGESPIAILHNPEASQPKFTTITSLKHFWRHVTFVPEGKNERSKVISDFITVNIAMEK